MEVSLVTREDETLRHSSRHHHHHHVQPLNYNNPNSTPTLRYPWLSHLHSQLGVSEPVSITEASVPLFGAAAFLSPADIGSSVGGQVSGSVDSCDSTAASNRYDSAADPFDKLSIEDVVEVRQLKEAYFQAMEKVPSLHGDNDIKSEELGQAYKRFVERRAGFLVATPYYNTLAMLDRSRQLHIAVAMSTYFIGAHLMDDKDFTLRRQRAQSNVVLSPTTLRQILSHHQYSDMMKFYTKFTSAFLDQTVTILMQVLSLFHPEPGAVAPEAVEAGRRHYGGLLARYVTAAMGPTHAVGQMASLLACQHEARKLVDLMDNLDLTPTQPKPTAHRPPPTTLLTNLQRVCQLMARARKERKDRNTPSTSSADSTDNSATISVEEAGQLMGSLAQCNDPEVLARARAILPAPLLSRLLNLIRSSSPQLQQPDPSLEPQSDLQPEPSSETQSNAQSLLRSQPHSNLLPQCNLFSQSRSQSQSSPQITPSTQVESSLQLQSNLESQSLQADDSRSSASVSPSRILFNTTPSLELLSDRISPKKSPTPLRSRTSHSNRSSQSSSPSRQFSSIHSPPVRSAALHTSPPLQFVPAPPSKFSYSSSQFSVMQSSPSRHSPPFQLPVFHSAPSPSRHSPPFQLPVVHSSPSRYSSPSQLSVTLSSPPRLSFPSPNTSPSLGQLRITPLPPVQSHELAIKRPSHSPVTFTPPSSSNSPASSTPPTSLPDVSHPS